jgi:formate-dependent nitrite reductase membrane component NrfD
VAIASLAALLIVLGARARQGNAADQRQLRTGLVGAAVIVVVVGLVAFAWTLTRP